MMLCRTCNVTVSNGGHSFPGFEVLTLRLALRYVAEYYASNSQWLSSVDSAAHKLFVCGCRPAASFVP